MSTSYLWRQRWLAGLETEYAWWATPSGQGVHQDLRDRVRPLPGGPTLEEVNWDDLRDRNRFTAEDASTVLDRVRNTYKALFQNELALRWDITSWDDSTGGPTLRYARRFSRRPERFPQTGTGVRFDYPLVVTSRAPHEDLIGKTVLNANSGAYGAQYDMARVDEQVAFGAAFCPLTDRWAGKVEGDIWALDDLCRSTSRYIRQDQTNYYLDRSWNSFTSFQRGNGSPLPQHGNVGAAPLFAPAPRLYRDTWLGGNKDSIRDPAIARRFLGRVGPETTWVFQEVNPNRLTAMVDSLNPPSGFYSTVIRSIRPIHQDLELYLEIGTGTPDFFKVKSGVRVDLTAYALEYPDNRVVWHDNGTAEVGRPPYAVYQPAQSGDYNYYPWNVPVANDVFRATDFSSWNGFRFTPTLGNGQYLDTNGYTHQPQSVQHPNRMRWQDGLVFQDGRVFLVLPVKQPTASDQWVRWHVRPAWYRPGTGTADHGKEPVSPFQDQTNPAAYGLALSEYPLGTWSNLPGGAPQETHIHDILGDFYWRDQKGRMVRVPSPLARDGIYDRLALRCSPNLTTNPARLIYHEALPVTVKVIQGSGDQLPTYQVDWAYPEGPVADYMAPLAAYLALLDGQHDHATDLALSGYADSAGFTTEDGYTQVVDRIALTRGETPTNTVACRFKYRAQDGGQAFQVGQAAPVALPLARYAATGDKQALVVCTPSGLVAGMEWGNDSTQPASVTAPTEARWVGERLYQGVFTGAVAMRLPNQAIFPFQEARKAYRTDIPSGTSLSNDSYYVSSYDVPQWSLAWGTIWPAGAPEVRQQVLAGGLPGTFTITGGVAYGISYTHEIQPVVYSGGSAGAGALYHQQTQDSACNGSTQVNTYSGTPFDIKTELGAVGRPCRVTWSNRDRSPNTAPFSGGLTSVEQELFSSVCNPGQFDSTSVSIDPPAQHYDPSREALTYSLPLDAGGQLRGYVAGHPYDKDGFSLSSADTIPWVGRLDLLVLPTAAGPGQAYSSGFTQGVDHYADGSALYNGMDAYYFSGRGLLSYVGNTVSFKIKEFAPDPVSPTAIKCLVPRQPTGGQVCNWWTPLPSVSAGLSPSPGAASAGLYVVPSFKSSTQVTLKVEWGALKTQYSASNALNCTRSAKDGLGLCYPISTSFYNLQDHLDASGQSSYSVKWTGKLQASTSLGSAYNLGALTSQDTQQVIPSGLQDLNLLALVGFAGSPAMSIETDAADGGVANLSGFAGGPVPAPPSNPDVGATQGGVRTSSNLSSVSATASATVGGQLIPVGARPAGIQAVPKSFSQEGSGKSTGVSEIITTGAPACGYFGGYTAIAGSHTHTLYDAQGDGNPWVNITEIQYEPTYGTDETQPDTFPQPEHPLLTGFKDAWSYPPDRIVDVFAYDWVTDPAPALRFVGANTPYRVNHVSTAGPKVYHLTGQVPTFGDGQVTYQAPGQSSLVVIDPETLLPARLDLLAVPLQDDPEQSLRFWQFLGAHAQESLLITGTGTSQYLEVARPFYSLLGPGAMVNVNPPSAIPDWRLAAGTNGYQVAYRWRYFNQGAQYMNWLQARLQDGTLQLEVTCSTRVVAGLSNPPLVFPLDPAALVVTTLNIQSKYTTFNPTYLRIDLNSNVWPTEVDEQVGRLSYGGSGRRLVKPGEAWQEAGLGPSGNRPAAAKRVQLTDPTSDQLAFRLPLGGYGIKGKLTLRLFVPSCQTTLWTQTVDLGNA